LHQTLRLLGASSKVLPRNSLQFLGLQGREGNDTEGDDLKRLVETGDSNARTVSKRRELFTVLPRSARRLHINMLS
jgi:hypothetical protein